MSAAFSSGQAGIGYGSPANISTASAENGSKERRAALWDFVKRRYVEGASYGLIASETGLRRNQVAWIVRKCGLQGTRGAPSEQVQKRPPRTIKQMMEDRRNRWSDPAVRAQVARAYWAKTPITKRSCKLIPTWVPDELEDEYRWWAMNDSEESAAAWAREAKRELMGAA